MTVATLITTLITTSKGYPMKRVITLLTALALLASGAALAQDQPATTETQTTETQVMTPSTPEEAMRTVQRTLLGQGVANAPTPQLAEAFNAWRTTLEGDATLEVVAVAVSDVEEALLADPFSQPELVNALQELALQMRTVATEGDQSLLVELASLIDQTADFIQNEGYTPRMEVDVP